MLHRLINFRFLPKSKRSNVNCADDIYTAAGVQHGEPLRVLDPEARQPHPHSGHRDLHLRPQICCLCQVLIIINCGAAHVACDML